MIVKIPFREQHLSPHLLGPFVPIYKCITCFSDGDQWIVAAWMSSSAGCWWECCILRKEERGLLEEGREGQEREQLIFMYPVRSQGSRHGDDGCEGEVGWKKGQRERHKETYYVNKHVWVYLWGPYVFYNTSICQCDIFKCVAYNGINKQHIIRMS